MEFTQPLTSQESYIQLNPLSKQTDSVAVGDLLRAAVDRVVHLPRRRPLHHHLRRHPTQDAGGQRGAA